MSKNILAKDDSKFITTEICKLKYDSLNSKLNIILVVMGLIAATQTSLVVLLLNRL